MTGEVLVRLIVPDPWSFTVLETLKRKLAMHQVIRVSRFKSWRLQFAELDQAQTRSLIEKLMTETALLANPNRDRWIIRLGRCTIPKEFWQPIRETEGVFVVRVTDHDDMIGKSMESVLKERIRMEGLAMVRYSTIWLLEIAAGPLGLRQVAEQAAIARRWRTGLLANPNSQKAEVFELRDYFERWQHVGSQA